MKLSVVARSRMKEEKICTLSVKNGVKLNLLRVGSDFLSYPVYIIRVNRHEVHKTYDLYDALQIFKGYSYETISNMNELF